MYFGRKKHINWRVCLHYWETKYTYLQDKDFATRLVKQYLWWAVYFHVKKKTTGSSNLDFQTMFYEYIKENKNLTEELT